MIYIDIYLDDPSIVAFYGADIFVFLLSSLLQHVSLSNQSSTVNHMEII